MRTVKSCGPDVAVLALSPRETKLLAGDGGKTAVLRGEHEASRKAIAQGRPGCFRRTCMLVCIFCQSANGTRDRGCGTHPVFPAPSCFGGKRDANLGHIMSRDRDTISPSLRAQRSNPSFRVRRTMDCFAPLAKTRRERSTIVARMSGAICGTTPTWLAASRMSLRSCRLQAVHHSYRQRDRILHLAQRKARLDRSDAVEPRQLVFQERFIRGKIGGDHAQQIVAVAGHQVAFQHLVPFRDRLGEAVEVLFLLP